MQKRTLLYFIGFISFLLGSLVLVIILFNTPWTDDDVQETIITASPDESISIISDTHLGCHVEQDKVDYLMDIIDSSDKVVIAGDFWDYYSCGFDKFIEKSEYQILFEKLLEKNTVYIYGNHDLEKFSDERVDRFSSVQTDRAYIEDGSLTYIVEHGHLIYPTLELRYPLLFGNRPMVRLGTLAEKVGVSILGEQFLDIYKSENESIKVWVNDNLNGDEVMVNGHTHYPEESLDERYLNSGLIRHGFASYLVIEDNEATLIKGEY